MSIQVTCECGKQFQVGDQFAGKRGKCKACGRTVTVPVPAAAPAGDEYDLAAMLPTGNERIDDAVVAAPAPAVTTKAPARSAFDGVPPLGKSSRKPTANAGGGVHISPGLATLIGLAIMIPVGICAVRQGPVKAGKEWDQIRPNAESNILSQITRALHHEYRLGGLNVINDDVLLHTKALTLSFDAPVIMFMLPESIPIQGFTTEGHYSGQFHPNTLTFDADIEVGGGIHKISGSTTDGNQSLQMDGQPVNDW